MIGDPIIPELQTSTPASSSSNDRAKVNELISVVTLEQVGAPAWDDFLNHNAQSLPTQTSTWESILRQTYGYRCHFLAAVQDGQIQGVLPLFRVKSPLTGDSLQSMAGAVCTATPQVAQALLCAADDLARQIGVDYLLLRDSRQSWDNCDLEVLDAHRGVRLHLPADIETAWKNLHKDLRYHIRNGTRKGDINIIVDRPLVDDFYEVLLQGSHQMGTPLYSKRFLLNVVQGFPGYFSTALGYAGNKPIAGFFNLILNSRVFGTWGTSLHSYISLMPTHRIYWTIIEHTISQGLDLLDMGRSAYPSSQYDFKAKWGNEVYPIYQLFRIYRGKTPPTLNVSQTIHENGGVSLFSRTWSKLPLPLARSLGPVIRRHIPFG
jgi:FemAB-related protein (PEP-CTERM system-associated)